MMINFINCSSQSQSWLDDKATRAIMMLDKWGTNFQYSIIQGTKPTDDDFYLTDYSVMGGDKLWAVKYDFIKKQLYKIDDKDVGVITLVCVDPTPKTNCNYCFPDLNFLSLIPCMIVCDDGCEHYMRHEICHAIHAYLKQQGKDLPDTQDYDLVKAQLSYSISSQEAMEIERKNLEDCLPYLFYLETPPKKFHWMIALYQTLITAMTMLVGLLKKKKPSKEWVIEQFVQAHAVFEGFFKDGTIAKVYNNPGCLKFANQKNAVKGGNGFALFNSEQDGWNALREQVRLNLSGKSSLYDINQDFYSYIYVYASTSPDNEKKAYAEFIAQKVGVSPNTKLKDLWN